MKGKLTVKLTDKTVSHCLVMQTVSLQYLSNYSDSKASKTRKQVRGVKPLEMIKQDESSQPGILKIKVPYLLSDSDCC